MVLVAVALVALALSAMYSVVNNAQRSQTERLRRELFLKLIATVRTNLEDPLVCRTILGGIAVPSVTAPLSMDPSSTTLGYADISIPVAFGSPAPITAGWKSATSPQVTLSKVRIRRLGNAIQQVQLDKAVPPYSTFPVRIYLIPTGMALNFNDLSASSTPVFPEYSIDLRANVTLADMKVKTCFGKDSVAAACEAVGGAFDPDDPNPDTRCNPDKRCFQSQLGTVTSPALCPAPFALPLWIGALGGNNIYLCSWCNNGVNDRY